MRNHDHRAGVSDHWVSNDVVSSDGVGNDGVGSDGVGNDGVGSDGVGSKSDSGTVLRGALVADVLDDSVSVISVGDSLHPAVRKVDRVAARGGVAVPLLGLGEVSSAVVIGHSVLILVDWRLGEIISNVASTGVGNQHSGRQAGDGTEESSSQESLAGVMF